LSAARTKSAAYGSRTSGSGRVGSTALAAATPSGVVATPGTMSQSRNSPAMSAPLSPGNRSITSRTSVYLASTTIRDTDHRSRHIPFRKAKNRGGPDPPRFSRIRYARRKRTSSAADPVGDQLGDLHRVERGALAGGVGREGPRTASPVRAGRSVTGPGHAARVRAGCRQRRGDVAELHPWGVGQQLPRPVRREGGGERRVRRDRVPREDGNPHARA